MKPLTVEQERRLVQRLKDGDERAFTLLVKMYQTPVYNIALRMLSGSREDALDVSQEIFVSISKAITSFREQSKLSTWVYRIAVNHCRNRIKYLARRRHSAHVGWDTTTEHADVQTSEAHKSSVARPDALYEGKKAQEFIHAALQRLDAEQREIIVLRDIQGLTYEEIVDATGLRLGTVKSRLHRGRMTLSRAYATWKSGVQE